MAIAKRIVLFLVLNFLIIITLSALVSILGIQPYMQSYGINYPILIAFSLVWGMGGALISLALSRMMATWFMGVKLIDSNTRDPGEIHLMEMVHRLCHSANITTMPKVGIYNSDELNAFSTGPTKSRALVAVSTGLLNRMNEPEIEGVLGHEIAHIANGDMVTMALLQGVVNAFSIFLSRILAFVVAEALRENGRSGISSGVYFLVSFISQIIFLILGSILVAWYSRLREYRADRGGAVFAGRQKMIAALTALKSSYETVETNQQPSVSNLKISGKGHGIFMLFESHPPLEKRIEKLTLATTIK